VNFFFWIALISLLLTITICLEIAMGMRRMTHIKNVPMLGSKKAPLVSIIIPACNEAATIEPALRSILSLEYDHLEIIVVNDRSTDKTRETLERMRSQYPRLRVFHLTDLPPGWLGKNHALQFGAGHAMGKYLLFIDADISLEKTTLSRAMHHILENRLDHVSMFFENISSNGLLNALFLEGVGGLMLLFKPWKAKDKQSGRYMGVGAFNLVKASAYRAVGCHRAVAMQPIDDIMLGKVLKRQGYGQDCLLGYGFVTVQWYGTVRELIHGVMKNTFAMFNYRVSLVLAGAVFIFLLNILPWWALIFTDGITRILFGSAILVRCIAFVKGFADAGINPASAVWSPVTPYVNIYIAVKAAVVTIRNKGINWRGTHYSLDELKANRV